MSSSKQTQKRMPTTYREFLRCPEMRHISAEVTLNRVVGYGFKERKLDANWGALSPEKEFWIWKLTPCQQYILPRVLYDILIDVQDGDEISWLPTSNYRYGGRQLSQATAIEHWFSLAPPGGDDAWRKRMSRIMCVISARGFMEIYYRALTSAPVVSSTKQSLIEEADIFSKAATYMGGCWGSQVDDRGEKHRQYIYNIYLKHIEGWMNKRWQNLAGLFVDYSWKKKYKIEEQGEVRYQLAQKKAKIYAAKLELQSEKTRYEEMVQELLRWENEIKDKEATTNELVIQLEDESEELLDKRSAYLLSATTKQLRDRIIGGEYGVDLLRDVKETTIPVVEILQAVSGTK